MVNTQLLDYVKQQLAQGLNKETIQHNLASTGGWNLSDINEAFSVLGVNQGVPISAVGTIPTAPVKYAGFWVRYVALMVDSIILSPVGFVMGFLLGVISIALGIEQKSMQIVGYFVSPLLTWIYYSLMTYYKGATLGKMMVGITVKADDFQKLSFGRVLLRETIGKFVSSIILGIGYIIAGVTQRKQALHDKFAHSVVVYKDPSNPSKAGLIIGIIIAAILPALAILGILASVVLVSLNVARQKGQDAKIMSELNSIRASAELYYSTNNNSYSQTRSCSSGMFADQNIQQLITGMSSKKVMCYAEGSSYSISSALSDSTKSYCVDNSGFGGSGTASDNGSEAVCTPMAPATVSNQTTTTNQNTPSIQTSSTGAYSYTLPSGWLVAQNGPQGMQALNQSSGYLLSITATAIPSLYGNITSVDQVTSVDQLKSSLIKKYPNATIVSVSTGTIGGKKAYLMNYYMSASDLTGTQNQSQSKQMSITEYTTVNNGSIYTLAFISALSDKASAQSNLQTIVDSLKFKQ